MTRPTSGTPQTCGAGQRKACHNTPEFFAHYFADGTFGTYACAAHLPAAVRRQIHDHGGRSITVEAIGGESR